MGRQLQPFTRNSTAGSRRHTRPGRPQCLPYRCASAHARAHSINHDCTLLLGQKGEQVEHASKSGDLLPYQDRDFGAELRLLETA